MALATAALSDVVRRGKAFFRTAFPGLPLGTRKFLGRLTRALSLNVWGLQKTGEDIRKDIVPSVQMSTAQLAEYAFTIGLPNGKGGYGPLERTAAAGGLAPLTGIIGTVFNDGLIATAEDGVTQIALSGAVTIPGSGSGLGSVEGAFIAVTEGTAGNLETGTVCSWESPPAGADPTFTLTSPLEGAIDVEDPPSIVTRIQQRWQTPPRGGKNEDYRIWAQKAAACDVWVYPRRNGTGSIDVVITNKGEGAGRIDVSGILPAIQVSLDANRPAGTQGARAIAATAGAGHAIRVRVVPSKGYEFDWDDTATPYTVASYVAGVSTTLELNTFAPQSLKDAITAGLKPRLQVLSTGGSPVPVPVRVTGYSDGGSTTTLTLESPPTSFTAPTVGDSVYAYGPVVDPIATEISAFEDSLGPSRVSGYADDKTVWNDTLDISSLIEIARTASDTDGTKLLSKVLSSGATIDGAVADVQGADNLASGPELLVASSIAVTA